MISGVDRIDGARRAQCARLIHGALVGCDIIVIRAKAERIGRRRIGRRRTIKFLAGMTGLFEPTAVIVPILIARGAETRINPTDDAGPVVRPRCRAIDIVAGSESRWRQYAWRYNASAPCASLPSSLAIAPNSVAASTHLPASIAQTARSIAI